jgi:hypothetical protein
MLHIDNSVFTALRKDKYSGYSFLKCDKQDLIQSGIARGHAIEICLNYSLLRITDGYQKYIGSLFTNID